MWMSALWGRLQTAVESQAAERCPLAEHTHSQPPPDLESLLKEGRGGGGGGKGGGEEGGM